MSKHKNTCPRCGGFLETLQSYAHCASCLYFEDYWFDSESAFHQAMRGEKEITKYQDEQVCEKKEASTHDEKECA